MASADPEIQRLIDMIGGFLQAGQDGG